VPTNAHARITQDTRTRTPAQSHINTHTHTAHTHGTPVVATDEPCELFEWARDGSIAELRSGLCLGVADGLADGVVLAVCGRGSARFLPTSAGFARRAPSASADGDAGGGAGACLGLVARGEDKRLGLLPCTDADTARLVQLRAPPASPLSPPPSPSTPAEAGVGAGRFAAYGSHVVAGSAFGVDDANADGDADGDTDGDADGVGEGGAIELAAPQDGEQLAQVIALPPGHPACRMGSRRRMCAQRIGASRAHAPARPVWAHAGTGRGPRPRRRVRRGTTRSNTGL
jgi:hypothetical protein